MKTRNKKYFFFFCCALLTLQALASVGGSGGGGGGLSGGPSQSPIPPQPTNALQILPPDFQKYEGYVYLQWTNAWGLHPLKLWGASDISSTNWILLDTITVSNTSATCDGFGFVEPVDEINALFTVIHTNITPAGDYLGMDAGFNSVIIHGGDGATNITYSVNAFFRLSYDAPNAVASNRSRLTGTNAVPVTFGTMAGGQDLFIQGLEWGSGTAALLFCFTTVRRGVANSERWD